MVVDLTPWQTPSIGPICIHKSIGYLTLANTVGSWEWCCWVGQVTLSLVMELSWSVTAADWLEQRPHCKKWSSEFKRTLREMAGYAKNDVLVKSKIRVILWHFFEMFSFDPSAIVHHQVKDFFFIPLHFVLLFFGSGLLIVFWSNSNITFITSIFFCIITLPVNYKSNFWSFINHLLTVYCQKLTMMSLYCFALKYLCCECLYLFVCWKKRAACECVCVCVWSSL